MEYKKKWSEREEGLLRYNQTPIHKRWLYKGANLRDSVA